LHGLLRRLSGIDAEAEAAVKVIAAFDQLVAHRADIGALVRAAAGLAECSAGINDPLRGIFVAVSPDGRSTEGRTVPKASSLAKVDDGSGAEVWLYRPNGPGPLDAIVAERMAAAAAIVLDRTFGSSSFAVDPGALESLLSAQVPEVDRARCAKLLGFSDARSIRAVAFVCDEPQAEAVTRAVDTVTSEIRSNGDVVQVAKVGETFAAITTAQAMPSSVPATMRAGVGPAVDPVRAPASWAAAKSALRFTLSLPGLRRPRVLTVEELGPLIALASFPIDELPAVGDVEAIMTLATSDPSGEHIHTLDAFCRAGSLRRTAAELFLHHTSVAARLDHISSVLGYAVDTPDGAFRARMALTLWQLSASLI
jgi:hypothetical protein